MQIVKTYPKCGYDDSVLTFLDVGVKFNDKDEMELFGDFGELEPQYIDSHLNLFVLNKECVKVHCRTCQYSWVESPMDSVERIEIDEVNLGAEFNEDSVERFVQYLVNQNDPSNSQFTRTGETPDWVKRQGSICIFPYGSFGGCDR